jgi:hypothetical protein
MNVKQQPCGFGYQPVPGLMNRHISRFLRAQRKNIRRVLAERGFVDLLAQMEELKRDSRRGFMAKNKIFQRIMNEYIARTTPASASTEAAHMARVKVAAHVDMQSDAESDPPDPDHGTRHYSGGGVPELEGAHDEHGAVVIEE